MPNSTNAHVLNIELPNLIDGQLIESFVNRGRLRLRGDKVYGPSESGRFEPGTGYKLIKVRSSSAFFARDSANKIAREFNGIVC